MKQYLIELVGAFFITLALVFTGNPLAVGLMFMAMYYVGESVSGGYYNPVLATAGWMRGVLSTEKMLSYSLVQAIGSALAIAVFASATSNIYAPEMQGDVFTSFLFELLLSSLFCLLFLTIATSKDYKGSVVNGLVVGLSLTAVMFATGSGLFNPAIALGSLLYGAFTRGAACFAADSIGVFVISPLLGAVIAGFGYDYFHKKVK